MRVCGCMGVVWMLEPVCCRLNLSRAERAVSGELQVDEVRVRRPGRLGRQPGSSKGGIGRWTESGGGAGQ